MTLLLATGESFVHVFVAGKVAEQGGPELAERLEAEGYDRYLKADA